MVKPQNLNFAAFLIEHFFDYESNHQNDRRYYHPHNNKFHKSNF
ncbi:hypothetical protein SAMN04487988_101195 [Algoriphagus hitonicola]|uniref:Uncharacterized protein n=1 Tax=Algoriphagus hitonicola TaxID=435880 RepID=A0A1I2NLI7_9BACT|nr:hypothetical protein SAMN04487988_101195 [Algoriphagus hitonicola]